MLAAPSINSKALSPWSFQDLVGGAPRPYCSYAITCWSVLRAPHGLGTVPTRAVYDARNLIKYEQVAVLQTPNRIWSHQPCQVSKGDELAG